MKTIFHKANTRGHANHGWLEANHSFSFANYYNIERMNFGVLRVLNDDIIAPNMGFATHPHDNMEIITIPLEGDLWHEDSMGNSSVIQEGEIQVMSAGTGILHSEKNSNQNKYLKCLQIWVMPNKQNIEPRYDQIKIEYVINEFKQILSPNIKDEGVWIYQNAWFHLGKFDSETKTNYIFKDETNGLYIFVIEGDAEINNQKLEKRDAIGVWETNKIEILASENSKILLLEVPMEF